MIDCTSNNTFSKLVQNDGYFLVVLFRENVVEKGSLTCTYKVRVGGVIISAIRLIINPLIPRNPVMMVTGIFFVDAGTSSGHSSSESAAIIGSGKSASAIFSNLVCAPYRNILSRENSTIKNSLIS